MGTRVTINQANLAAFLTSPTEPIVRAADRYTRRTANAARRNARVDTGKLRGSINERVTATTRRIRGRVWSPVDYAIYLHEGTGIYGPTGQPIRPKKKGGVLVFKPKGRGPAGAGQKLGKDGMVYVREVKGTPPDHFLENALRDSVPWPVRRLLS